MLFRGDIRRNAFRTLSGLAPTAASFLGVKISRVLILRISALLALRTLLSALSIPLDSAVLSYIWSFLFASVQASVAVAAAAHFLNIGGIFGFLASKLFARPADTPFVTFYTALVLAMGPLCSLLEAAVLTFEIMRLSRLATERMFESEAKGEGFLYRRLILTAAVLSYGAAASVIYLVHRVYPGNVPIAMSTIVAALFGLVVVVENAQILETALLALYCVLTVVIGLIEEFDAPTLWLDVFLLKKGTQYRKPYLTIFGETSHLQSEQVRAMVLVYTVSLSLIAMARVPRFFRLTLIGFDALQREEATVVTSQTDGGDTHVNQNAPALNAPLQTLHNTLALIALTFRFVLWTAEIHNSEYMPLPTRAVQIVAIMIFYRGFLGKSEKSKAHAQPEPLHDIAGNVINDAYQ